MVVHNLTHMRVDVKTYHKREVVDITAKIERTTTGSGLLNVFFQHTTGALAISDLDPGTDNDLLTALARLTPEGDWEHSHDPAHYPDHLWSTIIGASINIPYNSGKLALGKWQRVILIELDGPKLRSLLLTCLPTT